MPAKNVADTTFLLRNLMEQMTDNIYFKNAQSRFLKVNKAFCTWVNRSEEQIVGKTDFDLFASVHAQQAYKDEQRIIATGKPLIGIEEKETWADGHITWVSTTKMPLKNVAGEIIGTFGVSRDITNHKEMELRASYYAGKLRRIKDEIEKDVLMAAEMQKTFFPCSYPLFPSGAAPEECSVQFLHHYHAAEMVSGDFCAIHALSSTSVGMFLCDVMGHGVRAALVMALICALVEETALQEKDPGRFLARMNTLLLPILRQGDVFMYATACYMVFDTATGLLKHANAGHPVPIHLSSRSDTADWLMDRPEQRGPALAITKDSCFQTFERQIDPGEAVVMYTDGLYEVPGNGGEEFGEERLLQVARRYAAEDLERLFPALINAVKHFVQREAFNDDICMIGFKRRSILK